MSEIFGPRMHFLVPPFKHMFEVLNGDDETEEFGNCIKIRATKRKTLEMV